MQICCCFSLPQSVVEENAVLQQHVEQLEKENAELKLQLVDTESNFEVREKVSNLKESVRVLQAQVNQLASEKLEIRKKVVQDVLFANNCL